MRDELLIMVGTLLNLLVSSTVLSKLVRTIDNAVNHLTVGMWLSMDRKVPDRSLSPWSSRDLTQNFLSPTNKDRRIRKQLVR